MNFKKKFLVITSLFMILGSSFALATSQLPSGNISGDISNSGDVSTEEPTSSGDIISGDIDNSFSNVLESTAVDSEFTIDVNDSLEAAFEAIVSGDETFNFVVVTEPSHGIVSQETISEPLFTYKPTKDYTGTDSFTFRLESGELYSNVGTISITIRGNSEPIIPFYYEDMQDHWANFSASHLAARGMIIGEEINDDFYFYPDKNMTRAEFLLFVLSIVEADNTNYTNISGESMEIKFADEKEMPNWLLEKVKLAYNMKIISGVSDDGTVYFHPNALITRGEAFVMINNALLVKTNSSNTSGRLNYTDASNIPSWALSAISNLTSYKIIQGDSDNAINTSRVTTRGEAAELCYKLLKQIEIYDLTNNSGDLK